MNRRDFLAQPIESDQCRIWPGAVNSKGYGSVGFGATSKLAHRVAFEIHVGPIPEGMTIDHLCRVKRCVNPRHMEVVTAAENTRRRFEAQTHCLRGHEFTPENTYLKPTRGGGVSRQCRECGRARMRAWRAAS